MAMQIFWANQTEISRQRGVEKLDFTGLLFSFKCMTSTDEPKLNIILDIAET